MPKSARVPYDPPESPRSVGHTVPLRVRVADESNPLKLEKGGVLTQVDVEYETYGLISPKADNVVLICHALSGDAHVAGWDLQPQGKQRQYRSNKPGWWDQVVGPGKGIDTNRFHVICANVLGSCYGTTGPASINPETRKPYGLRFPWVTVSDWVEVQARLLDAIGIERLYAVVGGSLGGQQALEWALAMPDRVDRAIVLAASARLSVQGLAFNKVGRHAIQTDPNFRGGDYYRRKVPADGLSTARMLAHITYLSEEGMRQKFGRRRKPADAADDLSNVKFEVEGYLEHQAVSFVERFDANSYLYITRAMDWYDAAERWGGGDLGKAVARIKAATTVVSFSSDWLYPPASCQDLVMALCGAGKSVNYVNIPSHHGHDAFLVQTGPVNRVMAGTLSRRVP